MKKIAISLALLALLVTSCKKEDIEPLGIEGTKGCYTCNIIDLITVDGKTTERESYLLERCDNTKGDIDKFEKINIQYKVVDGKGVLKSFVKCYKNKG